MLHKLDVFLLFRNEGPSIHNRDKHWSMIKHMIVASIEGVEKELEMYILGH